MGLVGHEAGGETLSTDPASACDRSGRANFRTGVGLTARPFVAFPNASG